ARLTSTRAGPPTPSALSLHDALPISTGVVLNDPLPAGSGSGVTWSIDSSTGTPAQFVLSGAAGSQTLSLASSTLPAGAGYRVHIDRKSTRLNSSHRTKSYAVLRPNPK